MLLSLEKAAKSLQIFVPQRISDFFYQQVGVAQQPPGFEHFSFLDELQGRLFAQFKGKFLPCLVFATNIPLAALGVFTIAVRLRARGFA